MSLEVDLTQKPADFASMALNHDPADPKGQPTGQPPAEPPAAEPAKVPVTPSAAPELPKTPEAEPKTVVPPTSADPKGQPTKSVEELQKENDNATRKITELGQERARLFKAQLGFVSKNPDAIKDIHTEDPDLADQIVKEHWGFDSFDELMQHARIKEMEETDPASAARERKLLEVEKDNRTILTQLKSGTESMFYTAKGIRNNSFDPNYQAVQAALKKVSPELIKTNYAEALEIAHSIAFPGKTAVQIEEDKKKIALATGMGAPEARGTGAPSPTHQTHSPEQADFMSKVGIKT